MSCQSFNLKGKGAIKDPMKFRQQDIIVKFYTPFARVDQVRMFDVNRDTLKADLQPPTGLPSQEVGMVSIRVSCILCASTFRP